MALAGLSLLCHLMAVSFSFYTFRNPRYTFKRLAGCIHLMTAATVVVLIEVVSNGATFAAKHLTHSLFPVGSVSYHGFSYYLAWLVAAQFAAAGLTFLLFSRKRKNLNITDEEGRPLSDDQPQYMGRNWNTFLQPTILPLIIYYINIWRDLGGLLVLHNLAGNWNSRKYTVKYLCQTIWCLSYAVRDKDHWWFMFIFGSRK